MAKIWKSGSGSRNVEARQALPGAAWSSPEQARAGQSSQEQPRAARNSLEQPAAARSSQEQAEAARSSQESFPDSHAEGILPTALKANFSRSWELGRINVRTPIASYVWVINVFFHIKISVFVKNHIEIILKIYKVFLKWPGF